MNNKDCNQSFTERWVLENKDKNLVKPKYWNIISAFRKRIDPITLIIILTAILVCSIIYIGYNFVYVKYMPITDSLSVYLPR